MNIFEDLPLYITGQITFEEVIESIENKIQKAVEQIIAESERKI